MIAPRFNVNPNHAQFGRSLLDQLNRHVGVGFPVVQPLRDVYVGGRGPHGIVATDDLGGSDVDLTPMRATGTAASTSAIAVDTIKAVPFIVDHAHRLEQLAISVTTGAANGKIRLGIYASTNPRGGSIYPTTLLHGTAELAGTATAVVSETVNLDLEPGCVYWAAYLAGTLAPTVQTIPVASVDTSIMGGVSGVPSTGLTVAQAYAALPSTFPTGATLNTSAPPGMLLTFTAGTTGIGTLHLPAFFAPEGRWQLRSAWILKGTDLTQSLTGPYSMIEAALRIEDSTRVLGSYSQRTGKVAAGLPLRLTGVTTDGLAIPSGAVLETRIKQYGWARPTLDDASVVWWVANVGG